MRQQEMRLEAACQIARDAGLYAKRRFVDRANLHMTDKGPQDFVTEVDGEVEAIIKTQLAKLFPNEEIVGEETGGQIGTSCWFIDPIDGTTNFARGLPQFCISIAFMYGKDIEVGVIYDPVREELFSACLNRGAFLNGKKIQTASTTKLSKSVIEIGWSNQSPQRDYIALVDRTFQSGASVRRGGSGALALAYVADGRQDGYCELIMKPWDALAGLLLIKEAGGWINDYTGIANIMQGTLALGLAPGIKNSFLEKVMTDPKLDT